MGRGEEPLRLSFPLCYTLHDAHIRVEVDPDRQPEDSKATTHGDYVWALFYLFAVLLTLTSAGEHPIGAAVSGGGVWSGRRRRDRQTWLVSHQAGPSQAKPGQSIREIGETNWQLHSLKAENPAWSAGDSHTPDKQGPALDLREAAQPLPLFILFRHFVLGPVHSTPISCRLIFQGPVRSFQKHSLCIFFYI